MQLNTLKPVEGAHSKRKRVGRGMGSGIGGTSGRGHKGQRSRSGGYHKVGFEGGQMPLQRRLPKRGFSSPRKSDSCQIRLHELNGVAGDVIDVAVLRNAGLVNKGVLRAKVFLSGEITKAVRLKGVGATKGAKAAIEQAGGTVEE
ncbi:MAG: 50S ribosomal protein L15 [Arenicellales bacterium WSBS_2016_MAG_OTU3]